MDLRKYLDEMNMTQKEFAKKIGCETSHLNNYVNRKTAPSLSRAIIIYLVTSGQVNMIDMLSEKEKIKMQEKFSIKKSDDQ
jgi:transcriptional regulator with XRE-family HTH domain